MVAAARLPKCVRTMGTAPHGPQSAGHTRVYPSFGVALRARAPSLAAQSTRRSSTSPASIATCSAIPSGEPNASASTEPRLSLAADAAPTYSEYETSRPAKKAAVSGRSGTVSSPRPRRAAPTAPGTARTGRAPRGPCADSPRAAVRPPRDYFADVPRTSCGSAAPHSPGPAFRPRQPPRRAGRAERPAGRK